MGRRHTDEQPIGDDSFMDTIANLIGILIILVMVVGARSYTTAKEAIATAIEEQKQEAQEPARVAHQVSLDIDAQARQLVKYEQELANRSLERMVANDKVNILKHEIEKKLEGVDEESKEGLQSQLELSELQKQLADLLQQQGDLNNAVSPPAILQHLPTPMAKTVFGHEIHVMMDRAKVSVIPWDGLVEALKKDARHVASRNTQKSLITNDLGPIAGYMMKYALKSQTGVMSDGMTAKMGRMVELDKFILVPTEDVLRESLEQSLAPGGRLRAELTTHQGKNVTVTVWVYPDSFHVFRELKERLFAEGLLCAARPLPFGTPIGASPNGASSAAQ